MMRSSWSLVKLLGAIALAGLLAFGCAKSDPSKGTASSPSNGEVKEAANTESATPEAPKGLPLSSVPAELKHEAFHYYGLENPDAIEYEVVSSALASMETGTATTVLSAVEGGVARFTTSRTGSALSQMGDEEVEVRKDGVYNTKIGGQPIEPPQLVLPADVSAGKTWATKGKVTAKTPEGLQTFDQSFTYKVVGPEKVKTKAGEFDALKVTAKGVITVKNQKNQSEVAAWYVKGLGTVKMAISSSGARKVSMTIEATKVPEKKP